MPSWCRQVNWGNCGIPWGNCAALCVKDDWKGQFWGLRYCLSKLRSLLGFPSGMTSHSKIALCNWACIGRFKWKRIRIYYRASLNQTTFYDCISCGWRQFQAHGDKKMVPPYLLFYENSSTFSNAYVSNGCAHLDRVFISDLCYDISTTPPLGSPGGGSVSRGSIAQHKDRWRTLVSTVMNFGFHKCGEFLD
jgi:hypothetical protein